MERVDLSIIILSYNTKDLLLQCLESIKNMEHGTWNMELIVVDNGSKDGSGEVVNKFKAGALWANSKFKVELIENKKNLGFAAGNNIGIKEAKGRYILLLNSDTVVEKNTISEMLKFIEENPQVGVATCRVEFPDGRLDQACHRGFPTPWASLTYFLGLEKLFPKLHLFSQYHLGFLLQNLPHEIDSPSGAFYLVRREVIEKVGMLDEDYFMYAEDLDWSYRIKNAGWKIMYYPVVKIIHFKKQSGRAGEDPEVRRQATRHFYETMKTFYRKHYLNIYPRLITALIMLAIEIKKRLDLYTIY